MSKQNGATKRNEEAIEKSAAARRESRREKRHGTATPDWQSANPTLVLELIAIVTNLKGTITFGYTKDGGAYYINYYVDATPERVYCRESEGIDTFLGYEIESWSD